MGCSVILAQGPPRHDEKDHDATGRHEGGVPCTSGWPLPLLHVALRLASLQATVAADNRDDREDGALGAAAAVSAPIGCWRADDCREVPAAAAAANAPPVG